jgi:hypothetical protein
MNECEWRMVNGEWRMVNDRERKKEEEFHSIPQKQRGRQRETLHDADLQLQGAVSTTTTWWFGGSP